ncbi:unnamed protein product [Polarella glacialis]|uniref:Uncharacterized protein n=1 Tax=Polarella glacialis TaxID=89957 RepID=A0A813DLY4_POLGL|nr:unnamed protein product [Polarella glacialis]CAE8718738.1 unnamed protein product [Polarella glacialis]
MAAVRAMSSGTGRSTRHRPSSRHGSMAIACAMLLALAVVSGRHSSDAAKVWSLVSGGPARHHRTGTVAVSAASGGDKPTEGAPVPRDLYELSPSDEIASRKEDTYSGSTKGWLRIIGIGGIGSVLVLIFLLILGGGVAPSWLVGDWQP